MNNTTSFREKKRHFWKQNYRQFSNIRHTSGNQIVDHSDVVGASPVGILHLTLGFNILRKDNCKPRRETFKFWNLVRLILEILRYDNRDTPKAGMPSSSHCWCYHRGTLSCSSKSVQSIYRSGNRRWSLPLSNLQMGCSDLKIACQNSSPSNFHQGCRYGLLPPKMCMGWSAMT